MQRSPVRFLSFLLSRRYPLRRKKELNSVSELTQDRSVNEPSRPDLVQLSNEMVRLYKVQFGRGPTKARSDFAGPDTLICTLEDTLTPAERNMAALGEHQRLRDIRLFFQHATETEFRDSVERIIGRKVRAFISGMDTREDVSAEIFYLEPVARQQPPDATAAGANSTNSGGSAPKAPARV